MQSGCFFQFDDDLICWSSGAWQPSQLPAGGQPSLFVQPFFDSSEAPWKLASSWQRGSLEQWQASQDVGPLGDRAELQWQAADRRAFDRQFSAIQTLIQQGELKKVVPLTFETASSAHWNMAEIYAVALRALLWAKQTKQFAYGYWDEQGGVIGVTPETLFSLADGGETLHTMALAGTAAQDVRALDFLSDAKELAEHDFVARDLHSRLEEFGTVSMGLPQIASYGSVQHLKTTIGVELEKPVDFSTLVQHLHPTPALGGVPRLAAQQWLHLHDQPQRYYYGAPFGLQMPDGSAKCLVAIRNLQWRHQSGDKPTELYLFSGCGVVAASDVDKEWQELALKRRSVKQGLGL